MITESIFNIFLLFENEVCSKVAYRTHEYAGNDEGRIKLLQETVSDDLLAATHIGLAHSFSKTEYIARCRLGNSHNLFDEVFSSAGAGISPLMVVTEVHNGVIFVNYASEIGGLDINATWAALGGEGRMDDWLEKYLNADGLNLPQLIHDDYFLAIKLTFNAKLYVSAMKLLVSSIDSLAYIEYGNQPGVFVKWMDAYADLSPIESTAPELWEMRNGLLHMSTLNSNKVRKDRVRRISFKVSGAYTYQVPEVEGIFFFEFKALIDVFAAAISKWLTTYNDDREKFVKFVERYDEVISDSRLNSIDLTE